MPIENFEGWVKTFKSLFGASDKFPYDRKDGTRKKPHMKQIAFEDNPIMLLSPNAMEIDIGNASAEAQTPHYHILEDAEVIHYGNRRARRNVGGKVVAYGQPKAWGTSKSKGSQQYVDAQGGMRDYGQWQYRSGGNTKQVIQEYRSKTSGRRTELVAGDQNTKNVYSNIHYQYIERILDDIVPKFAMMIGARVGRMTVDMEEESRLVESQYLNQFDLE